MSPTTVSLVRIVIVLLAVSLVAYLAYRVPKLLLRPAAAPGQRACKPDDTYYYKDPNNHPYDC